MANLMQRLGLKLPIVQAPMAGVSTPAMAAAVTNAGALGSIGVGATDAAGARAMIEALRARTSGPFNVNVFCHRPAIADGRREQDWLAALEPVFKKYGAQPPTAIHEIYTSFLADEAMVQLFEDVRPAVVSFHFGLPSAQTIGRLKSAGVVLFSSATNLEEAEKAAAAGVDAIVAQGYEAGGHRGVFDSEAPDTRLGVLALTRLLASRIPLPVIAAGGIMDGAGIAAALDLGAELAQLGTAFVSCPESSADAFYREAILGPGASATRMTAVISGRPARCLANRFTGLEDADLKGLAIPDYPVAYDVGKALAAAGRAQGEGGFGAQWAGQGAPLARSLPAAELVLVLAQELAAARARTRGSPASAQAAAS